MWVCRLTHTHSTLSLSPFRSQLCIAAFSLCLLLYCLALLLLHCCYCSYARALSLSHCALASLLCLQCLSIVVGAACFRELYFSLFLFRAFAFWLILCNIYNWYVAYYDIYQKFSLIWRLNLKVVYFGRFTKSVSLRLNLGAIIHILLQSMLVVVLFS